MATLTAKRKAAIKRWQAAGAAKRKRDKTKAAAAWKKAKTAYMALPKKVRSQRGFSQMASSKMANIINKYWDMRVDRARARGGY